MLLQEMHEYRNAITNSSGTSSIRLKVQVLGQRSQDWRHFRLVSLGTGALLSAFEAVANAARDSLLLYCSKILYILVYFSTL